MSSCSCRASKKNCMTTPKHSAQTLRASSTAVAAETMQIAYFQSRRTWVFVCMGTFLLGSSCWNWMQPRNPPQKNVSGGRRSTMSKIPCTMHRQENYISESSYLVKDNSAMTKTDLRRRLTLRKPLPERMVLVFPWLDGEGGHPQDARLRNFDVSGQRLEVSLMGMEGTMKLEEQHSSLWHVRSSEGGHVAPGTLVQIYDATPDPEAPESAEMSGAAKSIVLQKSSLATGGLEIGMFFKDFVFDLGFGLFVLVKLSFCPAGMAWNGMAGFSLEGCPRDFDGVHVAFTVPLKRCTVALANITNLLTKSMSFLCFCVIISHIEK